MPFKPGQSGNPLGGAAAKHRVDLQKRLDARLLADFEAHGEVVIQKLRNENPAKYMDLILARCPKDQTDVTVKHSGTIEHVSVQEAARELAQLLAGDAKRDTPRALPN